jgi:hypothetical protein
VYGSKSGKNPRGNRRALRETTVYVHGLRSQDYELDDHAGVPDGEPSPHVVRLRGLGDEIPIGIVDLQRALADLFDVSHLLLDSLRRERFADPVRYVADLRGPVYATDPIGRVHDVLWAQALGGVDMHGWLRRYTSKDNRWRARRKFGDRWLDFVLAYGPLGLETNASEFGTLATDLTVWAAHVDPQSPAVELPEVIAAKTAKTDRVESYLPQVTNLDGQWRSPSLYSALAYTICERWKFGFRFGVCEGPLCERTFVKTRADSKEPEKRHRHCSPACKQATYRQRKRA